MFVTNVWKRLLYRPTAPRHQKAPQTSAFPRRSFRPRIDILEDRVVPSGYQQRDLVGYLPGMARHTDPNLNGWGMDYAPNGPFCGRKRGQRELFR